jgi:hypothetical protein
MSNKYSLASLCKTVLTVTTFSVIAAVSVPGKVLSFTTEGANLQDTTVQEQGLKSNLFINQFSQKESNFLLAKKKKHEDNNNNHHRNYDDRHNNHQDHDDDDDNDHKRENYRKKQGYSSKAFRDKDWNGLLQVGRLVDSNQKALVLQLYILDNPPTRNANVAYTVYTRQNNRWVQFYNTSRAIKIEKKGKKYFVNPEIIRLRNRQIDNIERSRLDLKIVTEIRYDYKNRREERLVFENVWNYNSINKINSISQLNNETDNRNNNYRRRDNDNNNYRR